MPDNSCNDHLNETMVSIPLAKYTEMVKRIQQLEDQREMDLLKRELEAMKDNYNEALCRAYRAEDKLKEAARV